MQAYSKAIAAIVGGLISVLTLSNVPLPEFINNPAWISGITTVVAGLLVWRSPANT